MKTLGFIIGLAARISLFIISVYFALLIINYIGWNY